MTEKNIMEQPGPLDTKHRNLIQILVMKKMLGEEMNEETERRWVDFYSPLIGRLVDENGEIKTLVLNEAYEQASQLILHLLGTDTEIKNQNQ